MARSLDIQGLLNALSMGAFQSGKKWKALCPNPDHDDSDPSWSIIDDSGHRLHGSHNCFSCGFGGGPWELVAAIRGLSLEDAGKWIRDAARGEAPRDRVRVPAIRVYLPEESSGYRLPVGVKIPGEDGSSWFVPALRYLAGRGVTARQVARWGVGFAIVGEAAMRIVFPVRTRGELVSHVARSFVGDEPPYLVPTSGKRGARPRDALFGEPAFDESLGVVTPSEGVFKSLALERAGAPNPCAVLGASNLSRTKLAILGAFPRILVAADPDAAGDAMYEEIARGCPRSDVVKLPLEAAPDDATHEHLVECLGVVRAV